MTSTRLERAVSAMDSALLPRAAGSHIGKIDNRAVFLVTVVYLIFMLSVSVYNLEKTIWFAIYPIVLAPLAHEKYERVFLDSLTVLPVVVLIGAFNPYFDQRVAFNVGSFDISYGWVSFVTIIIRGLLAMQALLLMVRISGFIEICDSMRKLGVPAVLSVQLYMLYRYISVLLNEASVMNRARVSRGYGKTRMPIGIWASFVGSLLMRTFDRGKRISMAMQARSFYHNISIGGNNSRWTTDDTVYCFIWITLFIALRFLNIGAMLLQLFQNS